MFALIPVDFFRNQPALQNLLMQNYTRTGNYNFPIGQLISIVLPNVLVLAGAIFFILILAGGVGMVAGAGKESSAQDKAKAQGAITYGVIGFLLVISAYFILQIVGKIIGVDFINPGNIF